MSVIKIGIGVVTTIALVLCIGLSGKIVETNNEGFYQLKQAAISGEMTVRNAAGMYLQNFGKVTTYQVSDMYYFSSSKDGSESEEESQPITVRFNDGGTALISGFIKFKLSTGEKNQFLLHKEFKNYDSVVNDLIRQHVASCLKQTASLMKAEETYSSRRAEFIALVEDQITKGIFDTISNEKVVTDASGKSFIRRTVNVLKNEAGKPVIKTDSPFLRYGVEVLSFNIKDIDFDSTIDALISKKKEAQQKMVVAKAQAEEAKQNAITAAEKGKASVAQAKAEEEVTKIREITQMKKEKEVAELRATKEFNVAKVTAEKQLTVAKLEKQAAAENAKAKLLRGEAEAKVAKLKVEAGLTPLRKAQIEKETHIGVATALATIKLPETFISGGGGSSGGAVNPFTAIGLESLINIKNNMIKKNTKNRRRK